ncbi:glycosyltransferase [Emticicia sp. C21]|uniref:glycosyltransferase n=1 Tax=Emticicia sp. C21 TaxID=2302915 RepID=UPI000E351FD1|nr:glycosyltransferase [Emticicia sp. C21]RFS13501.1 glycosyltransferase [Emticicia sp. C21]
MRIIICDIYVKLVGHNLGHIQNILRFLEQNPNETEYVFLLNPEAKTIPSITTSAKNVQITFFTDEEFAPHNSGMSLIKSTQLLWKSIMKYVSDWKADKLILMMVDMFQHTIGSSRSACEITGIMFNPYPRVIPAQGTLRAKQQTAVTKARKIFTSWWMLRNKHLKKVFIFNDRQTVKTMNETLGTKIFAYLPDPVYDYPSRDGLLIREKYRINANRKIFLAFGMIDSKKNVVNLLKGLQQLSAEEASRSCLLIVGKIRDEYQAPLAEAIAEAKQLRPELQVALESRFVGDDEMESFIGQSDVISLAYVNFYSSSGVIGLASRHNKPIIATKYGVVGEQTREYNLGITVDGHKSEEIKEAFQYFLNTSKVEYPQKAKQFIEDHTSEAFIRTLLEI